LNAGAQCAQSVSKKTGTNPVVLFPTRQRRALDMGAARAEQSAVGKNGRKSVFALSAG